MKSFAAASLVTLVSLLATAEGLKCFTCTGDRCGDPFSSPEDMKTECTPDLAQKSLNTLKSAANKLSSALENLGIGSGAPVDINAKMVCVKLEVKSGDNELVTRTCGAQAGDVDVCNALKGENTVCSSCTGDYCNGATAAHLSLALMSLTALLLASFSR